jgi:precorrin-2/cobalt-factor-2 C20-methyltransferase
MTGILYGVGVGPGDPELLTLKAVRMIRENPVIAVPGTEVRTSTAYRIAAQAVPEIVKKELISVDLPMVKDRKILRENHTQAAHRMEEYLAQGKNVVFLTLGDPTVYSTFSYIQHIVESDGYATGLVSGVTSFCAAAACLNQPLVEWQEPLHILPAVHMEDLSLKESGTYVLMKSGRRMADAREALRSSGRRVSMVENCGMPEEHIYRDLEAVPDQSGYFSVLIAREKGENAEEPKKNS